MELSPNHRRSESQPCQFAIAAGSGHRVGPLGARLGSAAASTLRPLGRRLAVRQRSPHRHFLVSGRRRTWCRGASRPGTRVGVRRMRTAAGRCSGTVSSGNIKQSPADHAKPRNYEPSPAACSACGCKLAKFGKVQTETQNEEKAAVHRDCQCCVCASRDHSISVGLGFHSALSRI